MSSRIQCLYTQWTGVWTRLESSRENKHLKLSIVFLALLLDNLLLTVVVPIIPDYLLVLEAASEEDKRHPLQDDVNSDSESDWWNITSFFNESHFRHWGSNSSDYNIWNDSSVFSLGEEYYDKENSRVGWLFSSKAIVQLISNPFIGPLTNRFGYSIPMFAGFVVTMSSTMLYAFGESYAVLFVARAIQGVGSSCTAIAGMTLLAHTYPEDRERSKAMGIALGGLALGVLIGYPFGGVMYEFVGKMAPFLVIAAVVFVEGVLQVWALQPSKKIEPVESGTPLHVLMRDPYILLAAGAILFPEMAMAMLEPTLPIWLIKHMDPPKWQLGVVFVPDSVGYWIGCTAFGVGAIKLGRWRVTIVGLLLMGVCLITIPFATHIYHLIAPHFGLGLALGMVDAAMMPLLALLVDTRHVAVYGSVYAIAQVAISLGFAIGPSVGGQAVKQVGFAWLMRGIGIVNIVYSPLCYFLKDPPSKDENKSILMRENGQHSYGQQEASCSHEPSFSYRQLEEER